MGTPESRTVQRSAPSSCTGKPFCTIGERGKRGKRRKTGEARRGEERRGEEQRAVCRANVAPTLFRARRSCAVLLSGQREDRRAE